MSLLTLLTQIGGLVWICVFLTFKLRKSKFSGLKKLLTFGIIYLLVSIFIVPLVAAQLGRVPLPILKSNKLSPQTYLTCLANRHYVTPKLKKELFVLADDIRKAEPHLRLVYLDACFPFIDGFPLLPHLSHKDGRKVDLSFYYSKAGRVGNLKPSNTGYGSYEGPLKNETDQTRICKSQNYWQYDFSKYLTFGSRDDLVFDPQNTRRLIQSMTKRKATQKVLLEPHLKKRLNLSSDKIRFQGCHSVRHDDHIHLQIN